MQELKSYPVIRVQRSAAGAIGTWFCPANPARPVSLAHRLLLAVTTAAGAIIIWCGPAAARGSETVQPSAGAPPRPDTAAIAMTGVTVTGGTTGGATGEPIATTSLASQTLDAVVVIGDRRPTEALSSPASISVLDRDALTLIGADHASEALNRLPGVFIHRGSGQEHLTAVRSPVLTGGAGAGSFLYLQNGVPLRSAGFANVNGLLEAHTEIASGIEVQRGPSGALYGANAIHGVFNVITPAPSARAPYAEVSIDTIGRIRGIAGIGHEAGGSSFFAGLSVLDDPGFRADSGVDSQKLSLAHEAGRGRIRVRTDFSAINTNQETAGFVEGPGAFEDPVVRRSNPNPEAFRDVRAFRLQSRIGIDEGEALSFSVTPFARYTDQDFLLHFLPSQALEENSHWSVGAQTAAYYDAPSGAFSLIAGLDGDYTQGALSEVQTIPTIFTFTQGVHYDYRVQAINLSPFVDVRAPVTDRLEARLAARFDYTRYDYDNLTDDGIVGRFLRPADRVDSFSTFSPKASLLYTLDNGVLALSYARGARPPQTTDLYRLQINQTTDAAAPETIDSVELGWRGIRAGRLSADLVGYFAVKDNFFFRDADGFNVNDGRTRHLGGEAEILYTLSDSLLLSSSITYGRHTYRFSRPVLSIPQATESISFGDDVDTAPRWLANTRLAWSPRALPVSAEAEWVFVDDYFTNAANSVRYEGHSIFNLRATYQAPRNIEIFATLRNIANTFFAERADFAFGDERFFPGEGRVLTLGVRINR